MVTNELVAALREQTAAIDRLTQALEHPPDCCAEPNPAGSDRHNQERRTFGLLQSCASLLGSGQYQRAFGQYQLAVIRPDIGAYRAQAQRLAKRLRDTGFKEAQEP